MLNTLSMRKIELLAPAKNADVGIEAIRHGADAVYIGAPAFGARAAAGNTIADIARLADYGHQYGAKTIIALNTILSDQELAEAERMAWQLYEAGVDALIIQDLGLLQMHLPPVELHASTQTDNRTVEKVRLLHRLGMTRVVLARELSIAEIATIHQAVPDVELECFVHGALCVCISGQCYMSEALQGRSANRGKCAQPCRLPMDLLTPQGKPLVRDKHLLSLRDMNRAQYLSQLLDAGVTSLKIEGRLKDVTYVKNVVAYYRRQLDAIMTGSTMYQSASVGRCTYTFEPCLEKSFNRGFTSYFAEGKREPMWNIDSPKSMGEQVGEVLRVGRDSFEYQGASLRNGDGLAVGSFGFRLNRYEAKADMAGTDRGLCFPLDGAKVCAQLKKGQAVWRNLDTAFEALLSKPSATRTIAVDTQYEANSQSLCLTMTCEDGVAAVITQTGVYEPAARPQTDNVVKQLQKLGGTIFEARKVEVKGGEWFVPSSVLSELRRQCVAELLQERQKMQTELRKSFVAPDYVAQAATTSAKGILPESYLANIRNQKARELFEKMGVENVEDAFEIQSSKEGMVMQTRHCLKYAAGQCPKYANRQPISLLDPAYKIGNELQLKIGNRKFILKFGCQNDCICKIFTIFAPSLNKTT